MKIIRALIAKTKDERMLAVTFGFEERYMQKSIPKQRAVSKYEQLIHCLVLPEPNIGRSIEAKSRKPCPVQVHYKNVAMQERDWSFRFDGTVDHYNSSIEWYGPQNT